MLTLEEIASIFTCVGVVAACVAAGIAAFEFRIIRRATIAEHERNQKEGTLVAYKEVESSLHKSTSAIYSFFSVGPFTDATAIKPIDYHEIANNSDLVEEIRGYLNLMERICGGVEMGIYSIDVFDRLYGDNSLRTDSLLGNYIERRREIRNCPDLYCDYEKVMDKLRRMHKTRTEEKPYNDQASLLHAI